MTFRVMHLFKTLTQLSPVSLALYALYELGLRTGYYKRKTSFDFRESRIGSWSIAPLFQLPAREALLNALGKQGPADLLAEADHVIAGTFRALGGPPLELKLSGDWPAEHWTEYASGRIKLPGDIKFVWEPARFGWALTLGRAYHVSGEDKYAQTFWKYFEAFHEHNPAGIGPHWMNGQEAAIRLMALVWADTVLASAPASSAARRTLLARSVAQHAARVQATLIYARSQNNNHLVTEAAALYTAGLAFPGTAWRALGWRWLNWALRHQISGYGEYIQHSTNYHRLVLVTALWVNAIRRDDWPPASALALARAAHWLFSMLDPVSGRAPNLGSNDGSDLFPLSSAAFADFRPAAQTAARAFLRTQMPAGPWDEMSAWFGLGPSAGGAASPAARTYEPEHYLTDNLRGRNSWAYLRASRFRSRLAHMDQLHLDLWWRGMNISLDPGTYLYNGEPPWDNGLLSTRVHNTVMLDDRDQMTRGGRFLTLDWFPAYSKTTFESDELILQRVVASHKGYRGVRHERRVTVFTDERWRVEDHLLPRRSASHLYRLHWLLLDGEWEIEMLPSAAELRVRLPQGGFTVQIAVQPSNLKPSTSLVRSGEVLHGTRNVSAIEGWFSPAYGVKQPALSLAVEVRSSQAVHFTTEFSFSD